MGKGVVKLRTKDPYKEIVANLKKKYGHSLCPDRKQSLRQVK